MYFLFVELKTLKAQNTFSEDPFYFYPFMVSICNVRMCSGHVELSNQITYNWNSKATDLLEFTAYTANSGKGAHTLNKKNTGKLKC